MLAWMLLAGENPRDYQAEFTVIPRIAEVAGSEGRGLLLLVLTSVFGWRIFGDHFSAIAGYDSRQNAADDLGAALRWAVTQSPPGGTAQGSVLPSNRAH
jgi:hypothetical protein